MIIVTGMHRSGTSLVAMTMENLGVSFGDHAAFYAADQWNAKGYFERRDVMDINSRMITGFDRTESALAALAGQVRYLLEPSLDRIAARGARYADEVRAVAKEPGVQGIKDPRFCLTWSAWGASVDIEACVVCIRHPFEVADSLRRRQRVPMRLGLRFWRYHIRSLREKTPPRMVVVDLESLIEQPEAELEMLASHLQLRIDGSEATRRFRTTFEPGMAKTYSPSERPELDGETKKLWDWLIGMRTISTFER